MADTKISALPSAASVADTDLIPIVADPSGTPATKKATRAVLLAGQAAKSGVEGFVDATADNDAARPTGFARVRWLAADSASPPTNAAVGDVIEYENEAAPYTSDDADTAATADKLVLRDAAGRAQVADPSADADIATKGYVDTAVAGAGGGTSLGPPVLTYSAARQLSLPGVSITKAEALSVNGTRIVYQPIRLRAARTLHALYAEVTTAGSAGALARIGLYQMNETFTPGALVTQSGDLAIDATGVISLTGLDIACAAGDYLLAIHPSVTASFRATTGTFVEGQPLDPSLGASMLDIMFFAIQTYGALPDPGAAITNVSRGSTPMSWFVFPEWS